MLLLNVELLMLQKLKPSTIFHVYNSVPLSSYWLFLVISRYFGHCRTQLIILRVAKMRTGHTAAVCSGAVEGKCHYPKYFWGNAVPRNNIRTKGNGDTVAFQQIGLQRNEKSR